MLIKKLNLSVTKKSLIYRETCFGRVGVALSILTNQVQ